MRPFFLRRPSPSTVSMNLHSACYIQALSKCFIFNLHLIITHEQLGDNFLLRKRDRLLFVDKILVSSTFASQSSSLIQVTGRCAWDDPGFVLPVSVSLVMPLPCSLQSQQWVMSSSAYGICICLQFAMPYLLEDLKIAASLAFFALPEPSLLWQIASTLTRPQE